MRDRHLDPPPPRLAAVILAGGQARRLGGRDKPMLPVGGVPMLARVLSAAAAAGAEPRVVVGPVRDDLPAGTLFVREEPAGGGPVAATAAGLALVDTDLVALLGADLPLLTAEAIGQLVSAVGSGPRRREVEPGAPSGAVFVDERGRRQLLCGVWRTAALTGALRGLARVEGAAVRTLVADLDVREVGWSGNPASGPPYLDCDTEDDLRRVGLL